LIRLRDVEMRRSPGRSIRTAIDTVILSSHDEGRLQCAGAPGDNRCMPNGSPRVQNPAELRDPFRPGEVVIATLGNPREKFWGMILALAPEGLSLSGTELASFEDLAVMVKDGEPFTPAVVFFPMHRIERVELDSPDGSLPSLSQRFLAKTGMEPATALTPPSASQPQPLPTPASKERV
jgi:hypothetical protein